MAENKGLMAIGRSFPVSFQGRFRRSRRHSPSVSGRKRAHDVRQKSQLVSGEVSIELDARPAPESNPSIVVIEACSRDPFGDVRPVLICFQVFGVHKVRIANQPLEPTPTDSGFGGCFEYDYILSWSESFQVFVSVLLTGMLSGEFRAPAPSSIRHATAATSGTCPFPAAWLRSCRLATPSATLPTPGSVSHQRPPVVLAICPILPGTFCFWKSWRRSVSQASTHVLSRSCGAAQLPLPITHHRASYRTEARLPRTRASPPRTSIGEFSTKTKRGRTSHTIRNISRQSPERAPSIPAPLPASDKS